MHIHWNNISTKWHVKGIRSITHVWDTTITCHVGLWSPCAPDQELYAVGASYGIIHPSTPKSYDALHCISLVVTMIKHPTFIIYKCIHWLLIRKGNYSEIREYNKKTSYNTFQYISFPSEKQYKDDLLVESCRARLFFFFLAENEQSLKCMRNIATDIYLLIKDKKSTKL